MVINSTELDSESQTNDTETDDTSTPNLDVYYQAQEDVTVTSHEQNETDLEDSTTRYKHN